MPPEPLSPNADAPADASWRQRFRRLPGRSPTLRLSRAVASARLWAGDGQLVQETVRGYTQEIQRFAFTDFQAVQIRRTTRGVVYNSILGSLLVLVGLLTWSADNHTGGNLVVGGCWAAPLLVLLVVNIARGPTCHTVLVTALGPQRLFSLSRMRQARRALETISAGVDAVQGALRPDEAARLVDQTSQAARVPVPQRPATPSGYQP